MDEAAWKKQEDKIQGQAPSCIELLSEFEALKFDFEAVKELRSHITHFLIHYLTVSLGHPWCHIEYITLLAIDSILCGTLKLGIHQ